MRALAVVEAAETLFFTLKNNVSECSLCLWCSCVDSCVLVLTLVLLCWLVCSKDHPEYCILCSRVDSGALVLALPLGLQVVP